MRIEAQGQWQEALDYFLSPKTQRKLEELGLEIVRLDGKNEQVILRCLDDEDLESYCRQIEKMSVDDTLCKPSPSQAAVRVTTPS